MGERSEWKESGVGAAGSRSAGAAGRFRSAAAPPAPALLLGRDEVPVDIGATGLVDRGHRAVRPGVDRVGRDPVALVGRVLVGEAGVHFPLVGPQRLQRNTRQSSTGGIPTVWAAVSTGNRLGLDATYLPEVSGQDRPAEVGGVRIELVLEPPRTPTTVQQEPVARAPVPSSTRIRALAEFPAGCSR